MKNILSIILLICTLNSFSQRKVSLDSQMKSSDKSIIGVPETDGCAAACITLLFSEAAYFIIDIMADHHEYLLDNLDTYPEALSFEGMLIGAGGDGNRFSVLPRIRATAGIFSTELRFNQGSYLDSSATDQFLEWQIIEFNTFPAERVNFRFGTGLLFDMINNSSYNEHFLSLETKFFDNKMSFVFEGRYAADYANLVDLYTEISLSVKIKAINYNHLKGYFTIGGMYQNFYNTKDVSGLQAGFQFQIN